MRRLAVLAVLVAAAAVAGGSAAAPTITAPPATFTDATGDSGRAPDLTGVSVTNDDHGLYSLTTTFATPFRPDSGLLVFLDTDRNTSTGQGSGGADYLLADFAGDSGLLAWDSSISNWVDPPTQATVGFAVAPDGTSVIARVNKSELDDTTSFDFLVASLEGNGSNGQFDSGPGFWTYTYQTVFTLSLVDARQSAARRGGTWTIAMSAARSDTFATVGPEATIACNARAGARELVLTRSSFVPVRDGADTLGMCVFKIPRTAKHGTALHATMSLSAGGQTVSHAFAGKVK